MSFTKEDKDKLVGHAFDALESFSKVVKPERAYDEGVGDKVLSLLTALRHLAKQRNLDFRHILDISGARYLQQSEVLKGVVTQQEDQGRPIRLRVNDYLTATQFRPAPQLPLNEQRLITEFGNIARVNRAMRETPEIRVRNVEDEDQVRQEIIDDLE
jgi:hypothetical protein